eukprot:gene32472-54957_t
MTQLESIKDLLLRLKPELMEKYSISSIGLFGSVVRNDFSPTTSDIDIIVDFSKPIGIEFIDLADYLELKIKRKIDLVSRNGIKQKSTDLLIDDILDSGHKILDYTYGLTLEQFSVDSKTVDAVIRNFEIIGEAANRLSEDFKETHSEIDWHKIRGFRNRIVHDYFGIDYSIVW